MSTMLSPLTLALAFSLAPQIAEAGPPPPPPPGLATTGEIVVTGIRTLTADHYGNIIVTDGSTIDCNGFVIYWDESRGANYGITAYGANNVTIKNCQISGSPDGAWHDGVALFNSNGAYLYNNVVHGFTANSAPRVNYGYYMTNSNDAVLVENLAIKVQRNGFYFTGSDGVTMVENAASLSGRDGFSLTWCDDLSLNGDIADNGDGDGFYIFYSQNAELDDVMAWNNNDAGLLFRYSDNAQVINSTARFNDTGARFDDSSTGGFIYASKFCNNDLDVEETSDSHSNNWHPFNTLSTQDLGGAPLPFIHCDAM